MIEFCIKLAGFPIGVSAVYESTRDFCSDYLTDEKPFLKTAVESRHMDYIRNSDMKTAASEHRSYREPSDNYIETLALCCAVTEKLLSYGVVLFHGTVLAVNGKAYMFTAKSGTGKTTHAGLWLKNFPDCHILNGDKPLLHFREGTVYACGSPWLGKENLGLNEILPLEAVCLLERDETNHIEEIPLKDSFDTLLHQCNIPEGNGNFLTGVQLMQELSSVRLYRLGCNMDDEAAIISYGAMVR